MKEKDLKRPLDEKTEEIKRYEKCFSRNFSTTWQSLSEFQISRSNKLDGLLEILL